MAPIRLSRGRRRSSLGLQGLNSVKAGVYGSSTPPLSKPVTFAPNVTPTSYHESMAASSSSACSTPEPGPSPILFPPPSSPAPTRRKKEAPGKRRSMGYIPRPPNAFMIFRANFVRAKHMPGSIETAHGSLSKIIGNIWRSLPPDEKRHWENKAKIAKAAHKAQYPEYRFKPVHDKAKKKPKKPKFIAPPDEERRCEEVAQLLIGGLKGEDLASAVRILDEKRKEGDDMPEEEDVEDRPSYFFHHHIHRRSSSLPPGIALPSVPFFAPTPSYPGRRASSVGPSMNYNDLDSMWSGLDCSSPSSWPADTPSPQYSEEDIPEVQPGIFQPGFSFQTATSSSSSSSSPCYELPPIGPLDSPYDLMAHSSSSSSPPELSNGSSNYSTPYSASSGSPAPSDVLPGHLWKDTTTTTTAMDGAYAPYYHMNIDMSSSQYPHSHQPELVNGGEYLDAYGVYPQQGQGQGQKPFAFEDMVNFDADVDPAAGYPLTQY